MAMSRSVLFKFSFNMFKRSKNYSPPSADACQSISNTENDIDKSIIRKKRAPEETNCSTFIDLLSRNRGDTY